MEDIYLLGDWKIIIKHEFGIIAACEKNLMVLLDKNHNSILVLTFDKDKNLIIEKGDGSYECLLVHSKKELYIF